MPLPRILLSHTLPAVATCWLPSPSPFPHARLCCKSLLSSPLPPHLAWDECRAESPSPVVFLLGSDAGLPSWPAVATHASQSPPHPSRSSRRCGFHWSGQIAWGWRAGWGPYQPSPCVTLQAVWPGRALNLQTGYKEALCSPPYLCRRMATLSL